MMGSCRPRERRAEGAEKERVYSSPPCGERSFRQSHRTDGRTDEEPTSRSATTYLVLTHIAACQASIIAASIVTERADGIAHFVRNMFSA